MGNKKMQTSEDVPVLASEDFFRPGESVFIHISNDYPDFVGVLHKHKFIEIVYVISGEATHVVGNHQVKASKGGLFIINYDTPHAFYGNENAKEPFINYDLLFTPDFFDSSMINANSFEALGSSFLFYSLFPEKQRIGPDLQLSGSSYNIFGELFNKIYVEYNNREKGYINIIRAYVVELIIKMFRKMDSLSTDSISNKQKQIINTTLEYLRNNFGTHVTLEDLAAKIFLSKHYFGRLFKSVTGMPVSVLLQQIRMEEACKLLATSDRKITDIAENCGFNDIKSFYNAFKKANGVTPGDYRNKSAIGLPDE